VRWKAATYGQDADPSQSPPQPGQNGEADGSNGGGGARYKVAPDTIAMLYDKWVMPMTKQVQVGRLISQTMKFTMLLCGLVTLHSGEV